MPPARAQPKTIRRSQPTGPDGVGPAPANATSRTAPFPFPLAPAGAFCDRVARLLYQRGAVDVLALDLADPALHDRFELLAEGRELGVGQHDVLVARLGRERDAGVVGCL